MNAEGNCPGGDEQPDVRWFTLRKENVYIYEKAGSQEGHDCYAFSYFRNILSV